MKRLISALLGVAPLGVIPIIATAQERTRSTRTRWIAAGATVFLVATAAVAIHVLIMPLDTAFFALARRYGL